MAAGILQSALRRRANNCLPRRKYDSPMYQKAYKEKRTSRVLWCNLVVYFNSTNFSKKLQNTQMERTQDSQFFLLFLLFVYIVSSHGDYSYIQ